MLKQLISAIFIVSCVLGFLSTEASADIQTQMSDERPIEHGKQMPEDFNGESDSDGEAEETDLEDDALTTHSTGFNGKHPLAFEPMNFAQVPSPFIEKFQRPPRA